MKERINGSKKGIAASLGVSRSLLYYKHKLPGKDIKLKDRIEETLKKYPSYGHKRIALYLKINKKRVLRVMKKYGIKPYRRRGKKRKYKKNTEDTAATNLLETTSITKPYQVYASDFTEVMHRGKKVYIATIEDLYTREIVGFNVLTNHSVELVANALLSAVMKHPIPDIIHSDQGSEYRSETYKILLKELGIKQSMSEAGCPWENGYQESFYDKFKVDLGDPNRFDTLGELVYEIYKTIYVYNHVRIHTALKMPPITYSHTFYQIQPVENVSNKMGT